MIKGKTSTGFEYEVNENIRKDYRFVTALAKLHSKNEAKAIDAYSTVVSLLLGENGEEDLCQHVMDEDGIVNFTRLGEEVAEILQLLPNDLKN